MHFLTERILWKVLRSAWSGGLEKLGGILREERKKIVGIFDSFERVYQRFGGFLEDSIIRHSLMGNFKVWSAYEA
jgi:hypothetical protein